MMEKKLREELIRSKLGRLQDSLEFIQEQLPSEFEAFRQSRLIRNALYKEVEFVIELVLDVCSIINADLRLGVPDTEDHVIDHLEGDKIFNTKAIELIREMKKFRNILVHRYGDVDDKRAYENIQEGLKDFEFIAREVEKLFDMHRNKKNVSRRKNVK